MSDKNNEVTDGNDDQAPDAELNKEGLKRKLEKAKEEILELGGAEAFKSGNWLLGLIERSFKTYYNNANAEYFRAKYPSLSAEDIAKKLISIAARNASLLGVVTGAVISTDEIVGVVTAGEMGVGLPANIAIFVGALGGEILLLTRIQLQLIANLAKVYGFPLDPNDPEDILTIIGFALGGSAAEAAGKFTAKASGRLAENGVRRYISKEVLQSLQALGRKIGVKILQRTVIKYVVPLVSMGVGGTWNYFSTKTIAKIAITHFKKESISNQQS